MDSEKIIKTYLKKNYRPRLHMGCGGNILKGWLNCDINSGPVFVDARKRLPFADGTFNYIFCEHFIEHLTLEEGNFFLRECWRVQKKGGRIRISTPDLFKLILTYLDKNPHVRLFQALKRHSLAKKRNISGCEFFNDKMHDWGHKFIYDKIMIKNNLEMAGYGDIQEVEFGRSLYNVFKNIEGHADVEWMKYAEPMIFEARKVWDRLKK